MIRGAGPKRPGPTQLQAMLERAVGLHRAGRLTEALAIYRRLLQAAPKHPDTLHLFGLALHQSGQSRAALAPLQSAVANAGDQAAFWRSLVTVLRAVGEPGRAREALTRALTVLPEDATLWGLLGDIEAGEQDYEAASRAYQRALAIGPPGPQLLSNLGAALNQLSRHGDALAALDRALALEPDLAVALVERGKALLRLGREAEALAPLRRAVQRDPGSLPALKTLAQALEEVGDVEAAVALIQRGLSIAPEDGELHSNLGHAYQLLGRFEAAQGALERALAARPDDVDALAAQLEGRALQPGDILAVRLKHIVGDPTRPVRERANAGFVLARALQQAGVHEEAFATADQANALARQLRPHDAAAYAIYVDGLIRAFGPTLFERLAGSGTSDPRPVFVVGMPRSGTSLVEQILASHRSVFGAGELTVLPALARTLPDRLGSTQPWPACASELGPVALQGVASDYLAAWPAAAAGAERVTDKLPANYHYLGLIALALPAARIIACRRDPRDVALSNYFHFFGRGQSFSHDLVALAEQVLAYRRLMTHWKSLLPPHAILEVEHERLVEDLEGESKRLVAHCGLDWDPACLTFHQTERTVRTASFRQVRQPVDRRSVGRWRAYRRQLAPFVERLAAAGVSLDEAP